MDDDYTEPKDLCRLKMVSSLVSGYNDNVNARVEASGSATQRPSSAPPSLCGHNVSGSCQFCTVGRVPSRNFSGTQALGRHSASSLSASKSFETPYGVVRQTSSSIVEPVRTHSGNSQESFRREMSVYKLNAMPMLAEDDELGKKTSDMTKRKNKREKGCGKAEKVRERIIRQQSADADKSEKTTGCSTILKMICTCNRASDNTTDNDCVNSGQLLDVTGDIKDSDSGVF